MEGKIIMINLSNYIKECEKNNIQILENTDSLHSDNKSIVKIHQIINYQNTNKYPNKKFFQRNCEESENVYCLPLGIQDNTESLIEKTLEKKLDKSILCSSQYSQFTRKETLPKYSFVTYFEKEPIEKYLENIAKSKYVISPHGMNPDCYRHWESLYLNSIPITLKHPKLKSFEDLPILFLNSWDELTEELLINEYERLLNKSREKLDLNYWINLMKE